MKHTPGPWLLGKIGDTVITNAETPTSKDHFEYYGGQVVAESISSDDDRRLIAAAPQLFEALDSLVKFYDDGVRTYEPHCSPEEAIVWWIARNALKKARGEEIEKR
jgi:hypothetical protein